VNLLPTVIGIIAMPTLNCWMFWRVFRRSTGSKVMESACIAGMLFMVMAMAMRTDGCPIWISAWLCLLGLFAGFAMIFFIVQQGFSALRKKLQNHRVESE
jgi:hypothetical protein